MTSRERVLTTLQHREPDRVPVDLGATTVSGMHVTAVAALRDRLGLEKHPVKVYECLQMLGLIEDDLRAALGVDTQTVLPRSTTFGFPVTDWKPARLFGLDVLVPGGFNTTLDASGATLLYPQGDTTAPPSGRMPAGGYFFDVIVRQEPIVEERLNPEDNLEEYTPIDDEALEYFARETRAARASGRAVAVNFGGTALGDIARVPGPQLKHPRGIRDVAEWYMSTVSRRDYIRRVFSRQCEIALANLEKIYAAVGENIDILYVCGTDFGTQSSTFCSVATFRDLYLPYYRSVNDWVHRHSGWKTFKHSCGSVLRFIDSLIEAGFDILNPVQCSAAGMDPERLKSLYGGRIVFWGGGVDTQQVLPFGTPAEVREQVLRRCEIFARGGGFVFNAIHNIQAETPVDNIIALFDAVREFNGKRSLISA